MEFFPPSFLNNLVPDLLKPDPEEDGKLNSFGEKMQLAVDAVTDTTEKVSRFREIIDQLEEKDVDADGNDQSNKEKDLEADIIASDKVCDIEDANDALLSAQVALVEARRAIAVAEIAYIEAKGDFESDKAKFLSLKVQEAAIKAENRGQAGKKAAPKLGGPDMLGSRSTLNVRDTRFFLSQRATASIRRGFPQFTKLLRYAAIRSRSRTAQRATCNHHTYIYIYVLAVR